MHPNVTLVSTQCDTILNTIAQAGDPSWPLSAWNHISLSCWPPWSSPLHQHSQSNAQQCPKHAHCDCSSALIETPVPGCHPADHGGQEKKEGGVRRGEGGGGQGQGGQHAAQGREKLQKIAMREFWRHLLATTAPMISIKSCKHPVNSSSDAFGRTASVKLLRNESYSRSGMSSSSSSSMSRSSRVGLW